MATVAAVLFAVDLDAQCYGRAIMTEAVSIVLALAMVWWRLRDADWRRAGWLAGALTLTRPNLATVALGLGLVELAARRRPRVALAAIWPSALLLAGWLGLVTLGGGNPRDAFGRIGALSTFGTAYEAQAHRSAYQAAQRLNGGLRPSNPPADWTAMRWLGDEMVRADPWGYLAARLRIVPLVCQQATPFPWAFLDRSQAWVRWLLAWRGAYRAALYASSPLLVVLLLSAAAGFSPA